MCGKETKFCNTRSGQTNYYIDFSIGDIITAIYFRNLSKSPNLFLLSWNNSNDGRRHLNNQILLGRNEWKNNHFVYDQCKQDVVYFWFDRRSH